MLGLGRNALRARAWILLAAALLTVWHASALAQASGVPGAEAAATIDRFQARIDALKRRTDIQPGLRTRVVKAYKSAIAALESARSDRRRAEQLRAAARAAPTELAQVNARIDKLDKPLAAADLGSMSRSELSERADRINHRLAATEAKLSDLRDRLAHFAQRPDAARAALRGARRALESMAGAAKPRGDQPSLLTEAEQAAASAQREALTAKIARLQQELAGMDSRERLAEAKRSLAQARLGRDNRSLAAVQKALGARQHETAQNLRSQSREKLTELKNAAAPIAAAAQTNVRLADQLARVGAASQGLAERRLRARSRAEDIQRRLNLVRRQLEIGGTSIALGDVLRAQRRQLAAGGAASDKPPPNIAAAELRRFQLQQNRAELNDLSQRAAALADAAGVRLAPEQKRSLIGLLEQRRDIVERALDAESRYIDIGRDLRASSAQYQDSLAAFNHLLDERLIWLPSFAPISTAWFGQLAAALPWALDAAAWRGAAVAIGRGAAQRKLIAAAALAAIALLLAAGRPLRARLARLAEPLGNVSHDSFWLTFRALLITLLLTVPYALLVLLAGYLMRQAPAADAFTRGVAASLVGLAILGLVIEPFVQICRRNGLADKHFRWGEKARRGLHRHLRLLLAALVVPTVVITLTEFVGADVERATLGRAAFMFSALAIAALAWRLLHPNRGVLADVLGDNQKRHWRLGYLWLPLAAGTPLLLCGLAAWGYYYTALQLQTKFFYSAGLLGGCMILYSLIVRWVTIAERRIALARARRKREEAREARATREAAAAAGDSAPETLDTLEIDLVQISEQSRGLIQILITLLVGAGLWLIWSTTLPALNLLDEITLWHYTNRVDGATQLTDVTLGALLLALAVGVVTALAGRNLPGFLEITILRRFSLEAGSRYAIATLFKYAIVILGMLVAISLIGVHWSSIQWLVAALGVGLGFGLQEIFANFISGIVILFERPARVGDTVSVGSYTGTVSRIRIRATTVTDWDNKEVVIPNKTFVTETVLNWTLSDDITRLIVSVHVAFDTDMDLAEKLIMDAIRTEPVALDDPAPSVFVVGYDDSAIHYEARVFYHDLYNLLPLQHALYRRIHAAFGDNEIAVSFPQRALHLRSVADSVRDALAGARGEQPTPGAS